MIWTYDFNIINYWINIIWEVLMSERDIKISAGEVEVTAMLNQSSTSDLIWDSLPIEEPASIWGDEIYFRTSIEVDEDDAQEVVDIGDIGYWPPGSAICLFFGLTPASNGNEIRPASAVNLVGKIQGDSTKLKKVNSGDTIIIKKVD